MKNTETQNSGTPEPESSAPQKTLGMYQSEELETGSENQPDENGCPTFLSNLRPGFWD